MLSLHKADYLLTMYGPMCSLRSAGDLKHVKCMLPYQNGQDFYLFVEQGILSSGVLRSVDW